MKKVVKNIYKAIRSIIVIVLLTIVTVYAALYILLSIPKVQNYVREIGEKELSTLLRTNVKIDKINISPLDEVALYNVKIPTPDGKNAISVKKISAGISLFDLLTTGRLVFNYAEVIEMDVHISKATPESPLNIQFIVDALKSKDKNKPPTQFDIRLNAVIVRQCAVSYDVDSQPHKDADLFDSNHIQLKYINADIRIPELKNDYFTFDIRRLSFYEKSGFELSRLAAYLHIDKRHIVASNLIFEMPGSYIAPKDISLTFSDLNYLGKEICSTPISFETEESKVTLSDFRAFVPAFGKITDPIYLTMKMIGSVNNPEIKKLSIHTSGNWLSLNTKASVRNLLHKEDLSVDIPQIQLNVQTAEVGEWLCEHQMVNNNLSDLIRRAQYISANGKFDYKGNNATYIGTVGSDFGTLQTDGVLSLDNGLTDFKGAVSSDNLHISRLLDKGELLGDVSFDVTADISVIDKLPVGNITGVVKYIDFKGYRYNNIRADISVDKNEYEGMLSLHDANADFEIEGNAAFDGVNSRYDLVSHIKSLDLQKLNLAKLPYAISTNIDAHLSGNNLDNIIGDLNITDINVTNRSGDKLTIDGICVSSMDEGSQRNITITSDYLNGEIKGIVSMNTLKRDAFELLSSSFPEMTSSLLSNMAKKQSSANDFSYYLNVSNSRTITDFFNIPISAVDSVTVSGVFKAADKKMSFGLDAPLLLFKNKIIENTSVAFNIDNLSQDINLNVSSQLDNKNGNILLLLNGVGANDRLDLDLQWAYDRTHDFSGNVSLSTLFSKPDGKSSPMVDVKINPSHFVVNDTVWNIQESSVKIVGKRIEVNQFCVNREDQFIKADGAVSKSADDVLTMQLQDIDLGYVFETLNINHVAFAGRATGDFFASQLLSKEPNLQTPNLHVTNFSYHNAPLGDADINSHWDNTSKGIIINADIHQLNHRNTYVRGAVYPTRDSLDFKFDADHVNVQVIKPFMSAFTSDVEGEASGKAELYGTFKFINMKGRLFADRFRLRIDQTNTYYSVSDSIIMNPGEIKISNAQIKDDFGNTALLNGEITHSYFKNAHFNFAVTDVKNLLCYNTTAKDNPRWYGRVFGNGSAFIVGRPGVVNIDVNMSAAPNSNFYFVISDQEDAGEYNFITFTDRRREEQERQAINEREKLIKDLQTSKSNNDSGTAFRINMLVDANPNVAITMVMDPEAGDRIRATGNGNMRIEYDSSDGLTMFGTYTAEDGKYNFTLQDIIVREFRLKPGAQISFHGDPLNATLDLTASYSVNANLSDLDESFTQDKDLNRTLVPVNALLKVAGAMSQPDISFDLEFPSLTQDVYRKVKSIISTDDMMNQQIIYLLALNRFYTPEYMGNTAKNNELAAVASSTISSQLSNILGQLSDKWTIAPNFRSDKGDFSDTEVELALSSRLLNNRLLLNGNFGYTDNALNSNSFIGDFDVEYLLTKNGNFRLKAYNRYNDQNYYIRNALTTQGVGIMFKHDFSNIFKRKSRQPSDTVTQLSAPQDTLK